MDSLTVISILSDVEDVNSIQEFIIRDGKYLQGQSPAEAVGNDHTDFNDKAASENYGTALPPSAKSLTASRNYYRFMRVNFARSSDFYGRITIYNLELLGQD